MSDNVHKRSVYFVNNILPWGVSIILFIVIMIMGFHYRNYKKMQSETTKQKNITKSLLETDGINFTSDL